METWHTVLTTREWALVTWVIILLGGIMANSGLRRSVGRVTRCLLQPILVASFLAAAAYIGASVWLLHRYEVWATDNLKSTIVWAVTFALVTMFQLNRLHDPHFYRRVLREAFSLTVVITFITEFYTFPFVIEFLLITVALFLTAMFEISKRNPQHMLVEGLVGCALGLVGAAYVLYSVFRTFGDPGILFTLDNGRDLLIPAVLTALYLPFLYSFGLWARYNAVFAVLHVWLPDKSLRQFAKRNAILRFATDVKSLDRWRHIIVTNRPTTRDGIMQSIVEAWSMKIGDAYPFPVTESDGWEPVAATQFLADYDLGTMNYKPTGDGEWSASSPYFEFGPPAAIWRNNIAYYVCGTQSAATEITLKLNINVPAEDRAAEDHFIVVAFSLIETAVGTDAVEVVESHLSCLHSFDQILGSTHVSLKKVEWHGGAVEGGYELILKLKRAVTG